MPNFVSFPWPAQHTGITGESHKHCNWTLHTGKAKGTEKKNLEVLNIHVSSNNVAVVILKL